MFIIKPGRVITAPPNRELLRLVEIAANDFREDLNNTENVPLTRIKPRQSSRNIEQEVSDQYQNNVSYFKAV